MKNSQERSGQKFDFMVINKQENLLIYKVPCAIPITMEKRYFLFAGSYFILVMKFQSFLN